MLTQNRLISCPYNIISLYMYICIGVQIYLHLHIYEFLCIGRWGCYSNQGNVSIRSCVRCEAACARGMMLLPRLDRGSLVNAPPRRVGSSLVPFACLLAS